LTKEFESPVLHQQHIEPGGHMPGRFR